jgi:glycine/D-amino acid oxidase-like deaminating enzyme
MLLKGVDPWDAYQTIRLKRANLAFIRSFVERHQVDADLDLGVDGLDFFPTQAALAGALGVWRYAVFAPLLRACGVEVLAGEEAMASHMRIRRSANGPSAASGSSPLPPSVGAGCIRLRRDFDTICAARFVIKVVDQAIAMGAQVETHTRVLSVDGAGADGCWVVRTDHGDVRCEKVVFATNAYTV